MPVLGMMSVFDWSEADNVKGGWTGREWFVVNKARFVVFVVGRKLVQKNLQHLVGRSEVGTRQHLDPNCEDGS